MSSKTLMSKIPWTLTVVLEASSGLLVATTPQQKAWDILQTGAEEKSAERRADAIPALGLLPHDNRAREMAESAIDDGSPEVRAAAAKALGDMLSRASIRKLTETLSDPDPAVVLAAAHSLLTLRDFAPAYDVYYAVLTGQRKASEGVVASERKVLQNPKKLAELCVETGLGFVPLAGMGVSAVKMLTKNDSSNVRAAAARILAKDPDPQSRDALVEALSDRSWVVRRAAVEAIAARGDPHLLAVVEPCMDDANDAVQYAAAAAVIRLSEARRVPIHRKD
jgi:HEAT repeat protein